MKLWLLNTFIEDNMGEVVSIFTKPKKADSQADESKKETTSKSFEEIAAANAAKEAKLAKERLEANKKVLRSYRITSKKT
jgi:Na+-transporting methylmalonyl-CoA/oxaloacetate decarboxylase gamma subunit